jgi:uncharacterized protein involved in outer membrane biogenesis
MRYFSIIAGRPVLALVLLAIGLPAMLIVLLFVLQVELDLTSSRASVAGLAGRALDREVQIDGDVQLLLGGKPRLKLSGLRLPEMTGGDGNTLTVDSLHVQVNLGALVGARLRFIELSVAGALIRSTVGDLDPGASTAEAGPQLEALLDSQPFFPDEMRIELADIQVELVDKRTGAASKLLLAAGSGSRSAGSSPLELELTGSWNDLPLRVNGSTQPSQKAGEWQQHLATLTMQFLGVDANLSGGVGSGPNNELLLDMAVQAQATDLSAWRGVLGLATLPVNQARLNARIRSDHGSLLLEGIDVSLDRSRINGVLSLRPGGQRPVLKAQLQVADLDMEKWRRSLQSRGSAGRGDVFDLLAGMPVPAALDVGISVYGTNILQPTGHRSDLRLDFSLDERALALDLAEPGTDAAAFKAAFRKARREGGFDYLFELRHPDIDIAALVSGTQLDGRIKGNLATSVELSSTGSSAGEIRAGLNGRVNLLMGAGRADVAVLDQLVGGLTEAVGSVFSEESKLAVVNCAALDATLDGGTVTIDLGLVDTSFSTTLVSGGVSLTTGGLDLNVIPRKKSLSLGVAPEVSINGSLREPTYDIKTGSLASSLGEFIANVAYPQSLLLGVFEEVAGDNPCVKMVTDKKPATTKPATVKQGVEKPATTKPGSAKPATGTSVTGLPETD